MNTTTAASKFRPVGMSAFERFNMPSTCGCCGREGLKKTVKMTDGAAIVFMGTGCAANAMNIDPDNFKRHQRAAQERWDRSGEHRAFLDAACPQFAGNEAKQTAMVGRLGLFDGWKSTGKIGTPKTYDARMQVADLCTAILGKNVDDEPVASPFATEDMPIVLAWRDHLRAMVRAAQA